MKKCPACGEINSDDAKFCDACGADLTWVPIEVAAPTGGPEPAPAAAPEAAASASPLEIPPVEAPVAPPAYAPPAPPVYAPTAPPMYAPPAMPAPVAVAARTGNKWMPLVLGVVAVALVVGGYFAYTTFFKGGPGSGAPVSAADYRTQALRYSNDLLSAGAGTDATAISQMGSTDPATRATAKAAWDRSLVQARAAMVSLRALVPPAEYQTMNTRILKGAAANEKILNALDPLMTKLASGTVTTAELSASPEYTAVTTILADPTWTADAADFAKAITELKSAATTTTP